MDISRQKVQELHARQYHWMCTVSSHNVERNKKVVVLNDKTAYSVQSVLILRSCDDLLLL